MVRPPGCGLLAAAAALNALSCPPLFWQKGGNLCPEELGKAPANPCHRAGVPCKRGAADGCPAGRAAEAGTHRGAGKPVAAGDAACRAAGTVPGAPTRRAGPPCSTSKAGAASQACLPACLQANTILTQSPAASYATWQVSRRACCSFAHDRAAQASCTGLAAPQVLCPRPGGALVASHLHTAALALPAPAACAGAAAVGRRQTGQLTTWNACTSVCQCESRRRSAQRLVPCRCHPALWERRRGYVVACVCSLLLPAWLRPAWGEEWACAPGRRIRRPPIRGVASSGPRARSHAGPSARSCLRCASCSASSRRRAACRSTRRAPGGRYRLLRLLRIQHAAHLAARAQRSPPLLAGRGYAGLQAITPLALVACQPLGRQRSTR